MPDIREVLNALDADDKANWLHHRAEIRRSFIHAHSITVGNANWTEEDDAFLDLIDIKLALLFDRSGRMAQDKTIVEKSDGDTIIEDIKREAAKVVRNDSEDAKFISQASAMLAQASEPQKAINGWATATH